MCTVNQQILAAVKLGVSQNKMIWHLLNLASPRLCCVHRRHLCLGPIGDFCIGDGEMYNYTRDASRCLAILSINASSSDEKN